jgi:hypothetical protein
MSLNGLSDLEHVALSRLVVENTWRIDHGLAGTVWELYTEDGELWYNGELFSSGAAEIREWANHRHPHELGRHIANNLRFEADGPDAATGSGVEIIYFAPEKQFGPEATLPYMIGEWTFRFRKTPDGWRFSYINFQRMFDRREEPPALF